MGKSFYRVSESLRADKALWSTTGLLVALLLIGLWLLWAISAHVVLYETSDSARVEVAGAAYPLQSSITGRVTFSELSLGKEVRVGDVLVEVESEDVRLNLGLERTRIATLRP